jgi:hypothetical protein
MLLRRPARQQRGAVFVQVIQGQVDDAAKVRAAMDRWAAELAPGAIGWLGSTAGVAEDAGPLVGRGPRGERKEPPPELKAQMDELGALSAGEPEFFDLRRPRLYSPR